MFISSPVKGRSGSSRNQMIRLKNQSQSLKSLNRKDSYSQSYSLAFDYRMNDAKTRLYLQGNFSPL